jgi:hypothetical protein
MICEESVAEVLSAQTLPCCVARNFLFLNQINFSGFFQLERSDECISSETRNQMRANTSEMGTGKLCQHITVSSSGFHIL